MNRLLQSLTLSALALFSAGANAAETTENFNSRKGVPIPSLRAQLQNSCWTFHHFDVNQNGWNPKLEGDGAMVADMEAPQSSNSGIYTPVLVVPTTVGVSFDYVFSENFSSYSRRWLKLCLANADNEILQVLEVVEFNGTHAKTPQKYNTEFKNLQPGEYRLVLLYGGSGETARIAVDQLQITAPFKYDGGCSIAPIALKAKITGRPDRTAFGSLMLNEKGSKTDQPLTAYLIKGSSHGKIQLNADGTFLFAPNKGFEGTSTSFVYKICGNGALCSGNATAYIDFPNVSTTLVDFKGAYKFNGNVELMWNTTESNHSVKFDLERSTDGRRWEPAGNLNKEPNVNVYAFIDRVGKNIAYKKDIYYRLKQTDAEGNSLMSRLLVVRVYNTKTLTMISVTPNPVKNDIAANIQLQEDSYVAMRIMNEAGELVIHKTAEGVTGLNTFMVDGSSQLQPGAYLLELIVKSKERMLVKLIKE